MEQTDSEEFAPPYSHTKYVLSLSKTGKAPETQVLPALTSEAILMQTNIFQEYLHGSVHAVRAVCV